MGVEKVYEHFYARFKALNRNHRDNILCALIRVNYGTPWVGDLKILHRFFPTWFHQYLVFNELSDLIEALSPFADEPTDSGITSIDLHVPVPHQTVTMKISV